MNKYTNYTDTIKELSYYKCLNSGKYTIWGKNITSHYIKYKRSIQYLLTSS